MIAGIAQLGERQTEDLKVAGSIPAVGIPSFLFFLFPPLLSQSPVNAVKSPTTLPPAPLDSAANLSMFAKHPQAIPGVGLIKFFQKKREGKKVGPAGT